MQPESFILAKLVLCVCGGWLGDVSGSAGSHALEKGSLSLQRATTLTEELTQDPYNTFSPAGVNRNWYIWMN